MCNPLLLQPYPARRSWSSMLAKAAGLLVLLLAATIGIVSLPATLQAAGNGILIDGIHANDLSTFGLYPGVYEYHETCGCRRMFEHLRAQGVRCDRVTEGTLTSEQLSHYRMLFINLVSAERPPFLVSEIAAIVQFVSQGGSLMVVTDHSNAYFHSHRLNPLLTELGIESFTDTSCEKAPYALCSGCGWISVTRFKPHPLTEGLQRLGMQTGGRLDPRYSVAFTSDRAWADAWYTDWFGAARSPGFYGNFEYDPGEPKGPLGVVLAKPLGHGRIVMTADQNMVGETFLHYGDNFRLWLNAMAWLLDNPKLRDANAYQKWRSPRIVLYEPATHAEFGRSDDDGAYRVFVLLTRYWWTFASDRWLEPCDLLIFAYNQCTLPAGHAAAVARHLTSGRNVLILNADSDLMDDEESVVRQVLAELPGTQPVRHQAKGRLTIELPGCGAIEILGPDTILDNARLGSAVDRPTESQKKYEQLLLESVRSALKSPEPGK